jgi:hypothetical protein
MKNKTIIKIGLAFPNALFIGVLFILPAILVIKSVLLDGFDSVSSSMLIMSIFFLILGLIPLTAVRKIIISTTSNKIFYYFTLIHFIKIGNSYNLDKFDTILTGSKLRTYAVGGGFLYSAKNYNKVKETDIWILDSKTKDKIEIRNVGSIKRAKHIIEQMKLATDFKMSVED